MAALCIQRRPTKDGFQYFSGGETVGVYYRRRFFAAGYRAATFRDGREKYVLRGFDPRTWILFGGMLLAVLLPGVPRGVFGAAILAGLLAFPRPPVIWETGRVVARQGPRRRPKRRQVRPLEGLCPLGPPPGAVRLDAGGGLNRRFTRPVN